MRIDAHQHFWRYDRLRDTWITDQMALLRRDFLPEQLAGELQANAMDACIAVQAGQSEQETTFLLDLAAECGLIRGVVGWVNLCAPDVRQRLQSCSRHRKLRGFRHILQAEPDDGFMLRPDFQRGIACLAEFGFTYDILIYPKHLLVAIELVDRFPQQRFVLDHLAKPEVKTGQLAPWRSHLGEIAKRPNVYAKLSGLVTEADWKRWRKEDFIPYLDVAFEAFTADRLMFGSDWPVCLLAASYQQVKGLIEDYVRHLAPQDKENIFGENAALFFGLRAEE
jgi:L-fuconolactonase